MFNISLVGDAKLTAALDAMPGAVREALITEITDLILGLQSYIVTEKLHGQVLNQRTGNLAGSIKASDTIVDGDSVRGEAFSSGDVKYAAFWEFGFHGDEQISAYQRLYKSIDDGKGEKTIAEAKSHTRHVSQDARSFMRTGLADQSEQIIQGLRDAVIRGMREPLGIPT
jgi:hypothetical protein